MRNGCFAAMAVDQLQAAQQATELFLGRFAAECLMSRNDALDRIARDVSDTLASSWHPHNAAHQTDK